MKFTAQQQHLSQAMAKAIAAVPSRPQRPVLGNLLLVASDSMIWVCGTDLSVAIKASAPAKVAVSGEITVPAKMALDIINATNRGDDITFSVADQIAKIETTSSGVFEVGTIEAIHFPEFPQVDTDTLIELPGDELRTAIRTALVAVSSDETKQILCGTSFKFDGTKLEVASTDGHRMITSSLACDQELEQIVIPEKILRTLTRTREKIIGIGVGQNQIIIKGNDMEIAGRLLDGHYPNYRQLIPQTFASKIEVNREEVIAAIERITIIATTHMNVIKLEQQGDQLLISAEAEASKAKASIAATFAGAEVKPMAFNGKYLLEGLKAMSGKTVTLNINAPASPVIAQGKGPALYLVMPVQIRS